MTDVLLDTGAWVALLDRREREHGPCVAALQGMTGRLISSEAVLTETLWLLGGLPQGARKCAEFVRRGSVTLVPISPASLARAVDLMEQYQNVPMDFADATLIVLAEDLNLDSIFTLDRRGFGVYRMRRRRPFRLIP
ncbi:MAG: type II toxin-antitoxin system VapC family toxin [Candidatus Methylomirabilales bacterium]